MSSVQASEQKDTLQESWVELHYQQNNGQGSGAAVPQTVLAPEPMPDMSQVIYPGSIEKLLIEAQKESRSPSRNNSRETSGRGSPKSPNSPNVEMTTETQDDRDPGTEWIWDWSSRPEMIPPSGYDGKFRHRAKKSRLSVRNTSVMKSGVFHVDNIPTLLLSHACSFFLGAAVMLLYLKKYCHWAAVSTPPY